MTSNQWVSPNTRFPNRSEPVLCAWKCGDAWRYGIAKFTGKRWLDVIPETINEEYVPPNYWQTLIPPDSRIDTECGQCAAGMNSFIDPATRQKMHARNGEVTACSAPETTSPRYPHWTCKHHGNFDARVEVGCPSCTRELRELVKLLRERPAVKAGAES